MISILYKEITTKYDFRFITKGIYDIIDQKIIHHVDRVDMNKSSTHRIEKDDEDALQVINSISYYHGFGSNSLSFIPLIDSMIKHNNLNLSSSNPYLFLHTAHDIPGFGMNIREHDIDSSFQPMYYRPLWNAKVGNILMNNCYNKYYVVNHNRCIRNKIFISHSMGAVAGLIAAAGESYNRSTSSSTTTDDKIIVILESPALLLSNQHMINNKNSNQTSSITQKTISNTLSKLSEFISDLSGRQQQQHHQQQHISITSVLKVLNIIRKVMIQIILYPLRLFVTVLLRSRFFWSQGLRSTYGRTNLNSDTNYQMFFDNYRLAAFAHNFDIDLINFIKAQSSFYDQNNDSIGCAFPTSNIIIPNVTTIDVILSLIRSKSTVMFIHGYEDKIISYHNSVRIVNYLRSVISNSEQKYLQLVLLNDTGHIPHEENVNTIVSILSNIII
jgi:predicted esterase